MHISQTIEYVQLEAFLLGIGSSIAFRGGAFVSPANTLKNEK
jgi:hypothetical protein